MHTPAVGFGGTRTVSAESDDLETRHARRHLEILRSARVIKSFMVRRRVGRRIHRHDTVTGVPAASGEHGNGHADSYSVTTKTRINQRLPHGNAPSEKPWKRYSTSSTPVVVTSESPMKLCKRH